MILAVSSLRARNRGEARGKELQSGQAVECTAKARRFGRRKLFLATCLLLSPLSDAFAHTVSIGYVAQGGGVFDVWYGTYHAGTNFTEGSLLLVGPSLSTTVAFTMVVTNKPSGLIDGTTNFYSNSAGTGLSGTPVPISGHGGSFNGQASSVLGWQGVHFTGITRPGTYTFTYVPIANPTAEWDPISNGILTASFTLSALTLGTTFTSLVPPEPPTNVRNVASGLDNFVANGGTLQAGLLESLQSVAGPVERRDERAFRRGGGRQRKGRIRADEPVSRAHARSVRQWTQLWRGFCSTAGPSAVARERWAWLRSNKQVFRLT